MLLGVLAYVPSTAEAGCNHGVKLNSEWSDLGISLEVNPSGLGGGNGAESESDPKPFPRDVPCSGPSCSRGPGVPYVPTPLPPLHGGLWCCTSFALPLPTPELVDGLADRVPS
ncbi:hypothetical protein ACYOEI_29940, partial [Singulisphaera rosea]